MTTNGWVKAAERSALGEGDVIGVIVNGQELALYDIEGQVFATDDICTHAYAKLSDGWFDNGEIECPLHAGRFDPQHRQPPRPASTTSGPTRCGSKVARYR